MPDPAMCVLCSNPAAFQSKRLEKVRVNLPVLAAFKLQEALLPIAVHLRFLYLACCAWLMHG